MTDHVEIMDLAHIVNRVEHSPTNGAALSKMRQKTCKICKAKFTPVRQFQNWCSPRCGTELALQRAEKARERQKARRARADRVRLKTRSDWLSEAQEACNAYIRERDKDKPCISCGTTNPNIQYAAGHYRTVGAAGELRFHPANIHRQCNKNCNLHRSGNIVEYRIRLIDRIGKDMVEWIEGPHQVQNWSIDDIKEIKEYYKQQLKWLKDNE